MDKKLQDILELLRCGIINVCFDDTIDKAEELKRQREFIAQARSAILKLFGEMVGSDKQHPPFPFNDFECPYCKRGGNDPTEIMSIVYKQGYNQRAKEIRERINGKSHKE